MLRPGEVREIPLHAARYQLIGVMLYNGDHYVADVLDAHLTAWIRYDANHNGGIGTIVPPPTGRTHHEGSDYYATALVYVRIGEAPTANASSVPGA